MEKGNKKEINNIMTILKKLDRVVVIKIGKEKIEDNKNKKKKSIMKRLLLIRPSAIARHLLFHSDQIYYAK